MSFKKRFIKNFGIGLLYLLLVLLTLLGVNRLLDVYPTIGGTLIITLSTIMFFIIVYGITKSQT